MDEFIPLSVPNIKGNEQKYVLEALSQEWVSTAGSYINRLEEEIASYLKVESAVACQSGTAGLHLALQVSGVDTDKEVIVPTLTFIAAVNPVKYLGATPIFMDCNETLTIDPYKLEQFCKEECELSNGKLINKLTKKHISAIVVVHVFGNTADMEKIMKIAKNYHLIVIEDATEVLGSYYTEGVYKGKFLGTIGDFGVYSFNGNKIITTGGGGMIVAKDAQKLKEIKYLSTQAKDDELNYIHNQVGYNYRMTNLQAAVGVGQLEQLENFIAVKEKNYMLYKDLLKEIEGVRLLEFASNIRPNYWFYSLQLDKKLSISIDMLIQNMRDFGIQTRPIWGLIHQQRPYASCQNFKIEKAEEYHQSIINLPCSSNLTTIQVQKVVEALKHILK